MNSFAHLLVTALHHTPVPLWKARVPYEVGVMRLAAQEKLVWTSETEFDESNEDSIAYILHAIFCARPCR